MLGAIVGDIAGSTYEFKETVKSEKDIEIFAPGSRWTDDTVLTLATALHFLTEKSYTECYQSFGQRYPGAGYGPMFHGWVGSDNPTPYDSCGNGSAMRASPIAWVATELDWALEEARKSAEVTHNHPEGIKGAQAIVAATYLARTGKTKEEIRDYVCKNFGYFLSQVKDINYNGGLTCQVTVPIAIAVFLESSSFKDCLVKAISLGGDTDTIACMAGSIAHAYYGEIPEMMERHCRRCLPLYQRQILDQFCRRYLAPPGQARCCNVS